jgi:hypothetical protein
MSVSFSNLLTPNNQPTNQRAIVDNNFVVANVALNVANANVTNTNSIDLQQAVPYPTTEIVNVQIGIGACANGLGPTNSRNIYGTIQVSADNSTFANSNIFSASLLTSAATNGKITATTSNVKLAPGEVRYIRAQFCGETDGGTPNNALVGYMKILF